ncbi:MAG TPA: phage baseplate assembly protein V [Halothiobacillus sp.]|nr:phage baseplate assembly protein V [Halothiobacillus sp.]
MDAFFNSVKHIASGLDRQFGHPRFGVVSSVNPADHTARVFIQPGDANNPNGILSGWLPIASQWIGNGWGMVCPPSPGDQVFLTSQEGDSDNYVIIGRVYAAQGGITPPPAPSGEFWLVHKTGSFIKLLNNGDIASSGNWTHTGSITATGDVIGNGISLDNHTHTSESPGTPTSAPIAGT